MAAHNWKSKKEECHQLVLKYRSYMIDKTGNAPIAPDDEGRWFYQMCAHRLPSGIEGKKLHLKLFEEYKIEIPITKVYDDWYMRISVQGYNTETDLDRLFSALEKEL